MSGRRVVVTGGGGYIGSFILRGLQRAGMEAVALDDLSEGHEEATRGFRLLRADYADEKSWKALAEEGEIAGVIHMASRCSVPESVRKPELYYEHLEKGIRLLQILRSIEVRNVVFSSTAAVYGEPEVELLRESHPLKPINPYGEIKRAFESMLSSYREAHGFRATALRYFNAAGAASDGSIGEDHEPESHLIPLVLQTAMGKRDHLSIFGTDYPTRDGTCVRDYIHVQDLAQAHVLALEALLAGERGSVYNLGTETGNTVQEVVAAAEEVTGKEIPLRREARREGDPAVLVASCSRAREELGWKPERGDLSVILADAWRWHSSHPDGYRSG